MNHKDYLRDSGIFKKGVSFYYNKNNVKVTDLEIVNRLNKYAVPPAWKNVWYASKPKCHIQVYGIDAGGKKQYILSQEWIKHAKYEKYNRTEECAINHTKYQSIQTNTSEEHIKQIIHVILIIHKLVHIHTKAMWKYFIN